MRISITSATNLECELDKECEWPSSMSMSMSMGMTMSWSMSMSMSVLIRDMAWIFVAYIGAAGES